jgi:hypothetical protein
MSTKTQGNILSMCREKEKKLPAIFFPGPKSEIIESAKKRK